MKDYHNYKYREVDSLGWDMRPYLNDTPKKEEALSADDKDSLRHKLRNLFFAYTLFTCKVSNNFSFFHCEQTALEILEKDPLCAEARFFLFLIELPPAKDFNDFTPPIQILHELECGHTESEPLTYYMFEKGALLKYTSVVYYRAMAEFFQQNVSSELKNCFVDTDKFLRKPMEEFFHKIYQQAYPYQQLVPQNPGFIGFIGNVVFSDSIFIDASPTQPQITQFVKAYIDCATKLTSLTADYPSRKHQSFVNELHFKWNEKERTVKKAPPLPCQREELPRSKSFKELILDRLLDFFEWLLLKKKKKRPALLVGRIQSEDDFEQKLNRLIPATVTALQNHGEDTLAEEFIRVHYNIEKIKPLFSNNSQYELFLQSRIYMYLEPYIRYILANTGVISSQRKDKFLTSVQKVNKLLDAKARNLTRDIDMVMDSEFDVTDKAIDAAIEEEGGDPCTNTKPQKKLLNDTTKKCEPNSYLFGVGCDFGPNS